MATTFGVLLLLTFGLFGSVRGYCSGLGANPGFSGAPRVQQVSLSRVRVSWPGLLTRPDCADDLLVKFWMRHDPNDYTLTEFLPTDAVQVDIDVTPRVEYEFQVSTVQLR